MDLVRLLDLVCVSAALLLTGHAVRMLRLRSQARRAITGRVRAPEPLTAPSSNRPCVCYDARGGVAAVDFLIDDGRRTVRVRTTGARFLLEGKPRPTDDAELDAPPPILEERAIYPTEVVSVLAELREEIDSEGSAAHPFREAPTRLAVLSSRRRPALILRGAPCDLIAETGRAAIVSLGAAAFCLFVGAAIGALLGV